MEKGKNQVGMLLEIGQYIEFGKLKNLEDSLKLGKIIGGKSCWIKNKSLKLRRFRIRIIYWNMKIHLNGTWVFAD